MTRPCLALILLVLVLSSVVADNRIGSPIKLNDNPSDRRSSSSSSSSGSAHVPHTSSRTYRHDNVRPMLMTSHGESDSASDSEAGEQPSVIKMSNSDREIVLKALEASFLNRFGLSRRPRPSRNVHIPQYMLDLYNQHVSGATGGARGGVRGTSGRTFYTANTVRSFFLTGSDDRADDVRENVVHYIFNVTDIPNDEELEGTELRLWREGVNDSSHHRQRIEVHEMLQARTSTRDPISRLIDTRAIDPKTSTWEVFDISALAAKWRREPAKNHGLEVRVLDTDREPSPLKHVRLKRSAQLESGQWHKEQPVVVTFSNDGKHKAKKRTKRRNKNRKRQKRKRCRRRSLYVDFQEVGWNDWIVAPPGYDAFYCHGECPFVLDENLNSTNHAIVQNLVNSVDPTAVPKPCCVPTELSAISMLYLDQNDKVTLKNYQDMVVEACGCR